MMADERLITDNGAVVSDSGIMLVNSDGECPDCGCDSNNHCLVADPCCGSGNRTYSFPLNDDGTIQTRFNAHTSLPFCFSVLVGEVLIYYIVDDQSEVVNPPCHPPAFYAESDCCPCCDSGKYCWWEWEFTYVVGGDPGTVTQYQRGCSGRGIGDDSTPWGWKLISSDGTTCVYRYRAWGRCCTGVDDCDWPDAPDAPSGSDCVPCQDFAPVYDVRVVSTSGHCEILGRKGIGDVDGSWAMDGFDAGRAIGTIKNYTDGTCTALNPPDPTQFGTDVTGVFGPNAPPFGVLGTLVLTGHYNHSFTLDLWAGIEIGRSAQTCCSWPRVVYFQYDTSYDVATGGNAFPYTGGMAVAVLRNCPTGAS